MCYSAVLIQCDQVYYQFPAANKNLINGITCVIIVNYTYVLKVHALNIRCNHLIHCQTKCYLFYELINVLFLIFSNQTSRDNIKTSTNYKKSIID